MPPQAVKPFPFPPGYSQEPKNLLVAQSLKDYVRIFLSRRAERPGGRFHDVDINELMRLAEDLGAVDKFEIAYIRKLINDHADYFHRPAQINRLRKYADRHKDLNKARTDDDFLDDVISAVPVSYFRNQEGTAFLKAARSLADALRASDEFHATHDTGNPVLVKAVNDAAATLRTFVKDLTLSDVDKPGRAARAAHLRNMLNLLARPFGAVEHESKWFRLSKKWVNWNRDITVYPKTYKKPKSIAKVKEEIQQRDPFRMVAGGHAFNIASSMGGKKKKRIGGLVTLDKYELDSGKQVEIVNPAEAAKYNLKAGQANRVVRSSAGTRLRDFTKAVSKMGDKGMALPVAGSTDAQSIGGLIATDLHSTGHTAGFLSQQLLELRVLDASAKEHVFSKDESVARGREGRWIWKLPGGGKRKLPWLPIAGALGVCGVVVEAVLKLDAAFNFRKTQPFVPRQWAEDSIVELRKKRQQNALFDYDHVSFYYAGGGGEDIETVRLNGWKRTSDPISSNADLLKSSPEILDHFGSAFLPDSLLRLAKMKAPDPANPNDPDADKTLKNLNKRKALVLAAKDAFARKLFFQHDEIEVGIPLPLKNGKPQYQRYQDALGDVQRMLLEEEMRTIIEVRFTPDVSEAMIGPGTGGPTCYLELATPLGAYSRRRIRQVFSRFDDLLRAGYNARPHLGKKTTATFADMKRLYGDVWADFNEVRKTMDPNGRFLPKENELLQRIFVE